VEFAITNKKLEVFRFKEASAMTLFYHRRQEIEASVKDGRFFNPEKVLSPHEKAVFKVKLACSRLSAAAYALCLT
jgi:hypothetical protein